jgi:hypothetical protein
MISSTPGMKKITTEIAELYFEDDILYTRILEGVDITLERAKANFEAAKTLGLPKRYAALSDGVAFANITKEAIAYGGTDEVNDPLIAHAILVKLLANRLIGNFIIKFHKPSAPTCLFTDQEEALKWLRGKLKEEKNK